MHTQHQGRRRRPALHAVTATVATTALAAVLAGCSLGADDGDGAEDATATQDATATPGTPEDPEVTIATHDSFTVPDETLAAFTERTGYEVTILPSGDAGELTNKLVLTAESPVADGVYGIDNAFATRAVEAGVLAEHTPADLPGSAEQYALPDADAAARLTPVDWSDVCVNVDDAWFEAEGIAPPQGLDDLLDPAYEDLFVTPGATTSSPGFAFLLATIGEYGEDGWQDYWEQLMANGAKVTSGWTDAYTVDFTTSGGDRPIVLSYSSSPPFTIPEGAEEPTTSALLDTCFRQVEYAGVLEGAANPDGAAAFVDFMVGQEFQSVLADNMYVYPVDDSVALPDLWARWATPADDPVEVDPAEVTENRDAWLQAWGEITTR